MEKISYALGMNIAQNLKASEIKNLNVEEFTKALRAVLNGEPTSLTPTEAQQILNEYFEKLNKELLEKVKKEGQDFLEKNARQEGVVSLESGLQYKVITEGKGAQPKATDSVECHYEGRLITGDVFDSSYQRGQTATFGVNQVIKGWVEALQLMKEGSKWQLFIPYHLAYGEQGAGAQIPPFSTLIFDVELIKIVK